MLIVNIQSIKTKILGKKKEIRTDLAQVASIFMATVQSVNISFVLKLYAKF